MKTSATVHPHGAKAAPAKPREAAQPEATALSNRGVQALIQRAEPSDADAQRRAMGERFGMSFAGVRLRTDEAAAAKAEQAGARAYAEGEEIGFAPGVYAPETPAGRLTLAHEFAHIAQRRGGNQRAAALPPLRDTAMAERQAERAADAVQNRRRPVVSAFATRAPLFDKGERTLKTSTDAEALLGVLNALASLPNGKDRDEMIDMLVIIAMQTGPVQKIAEDRLREMLEGLPQQNINDHQSAINALKKWTGKDVRAYDLLLYGRYWFADHSKNELGSALAMGVFRDYLHYAGGKWAILFFKQRINGADTLRANLAARVVADLLEGESDDDKKYAPNYAALREMARDNGWNSYGPLAVASATPRIFSALQAVRDQARALKRTVDMGPASDPFWQQDADRLDKFANALSTQGSLSRPNGQGGKTLLYSAENREETEHALVLEGQAQPELEMAQAYTAAAAAGVKLQNRVEALHVNAKALDEFLGASAAATSDERLALFDLRHEYIEVWLSVFGGTFGPGSGPLAQAYEMRLREVDQRFENFDQVVAQRKYKSARDRHNEYAKMWADGKEKYKLTGLFDEKFYGAMYAALTREEAMLSAGFTQGANMQLGTMAMPSPSATVDRPPTDLHVVAALDRDTSIFGLQAALFLVYATNLNIHTLMIKADVGSKSFRAEQGARLIKMRSELEGLWTQGNFDTFLANSKSYEQTLKGVIQDIKDRAKIDFLINLFITLIAALVTEGAALALRLASLSELLAVARTARALSSINTLVGVGVFTATELTLQKAFFGKEITALGALKSAATNLAFLGALKMVGKLAEPLAQGSMVRQLVIGHLVGFTGTAAVSATLTRIETGQWPSDVGMFLAQTAVTYLVIAGMHHAFQEIVAKPALTEASKARWDKLVIDNQALADQLRGSVYGGTLSPTQFEAMRNERIRIIEEARALHQVMKDGGLINQAYMDGINTLCDRTIADTKSAKFPLDATAPNDPVIRALPAPDSVPGLVRVGESDAYAYDPSKSSAPVNTMLERYRAKGFSVDGKNGLTRVTDPLGRTRFLLTAGPVENPRLMLPASSGLPIPAADALSRATGLNGTALQPVRDALAVINRDAETKLPAEYPDHTVLATLAMLVDQASLINPNWPIDAVRGVADAMSLERGIPRSAVRRLFLSVDAKKLPELFKTYHDIATSPNVSPGTPFLIADDLLPKNSVTLIDAWRQMQKAGLALPADMDLRAVRGLARQIDKMPGGWLQWLSNQSKEQRGSKLRALSGLTDPTMTLAENVVRLLTGMKADLAGTPGLNPLSGANGEAFVALLEGRRGVGKFDSPGARAAFVTKVDRMRGDVAMLQQGTELKSGNWQNIVGRANEVRKTTELLLQGATIISADRDVGSKGQLPNVNLANFTLPGGGRAINAPPGMDVHMDLLFKDAKGTLTAMELTTGELGLPTECAGLDPKNPAYGSDVDMAAMQAKVDADSPTHRKFMQYIKIYQLNKMAHALGTAWSGQPVDPAELVAQAEDFTAPAASALEDMGFKLERLDGTRETAAQVAARKKPGKKTK